ncbi:hypothetical protein Tco_0309302, partial [Tanacetum coccineum]
RFRSSYVSSPSLSPPDLPPRKHYRGTFELVEDDDEEDEEIEESLASDSVSEDAEDEGPITEDQDPAVGDEGLDAWDEGPGMRVESRSLKDESHGLDDESRGLDEEGHSVKSDRLSLGEEEEVVPKGQSSGSAPEPERPERVSASRQPTLTTWTNLEDGMVYIDFPAYPPPAPPVQTPPLPEWSSGLLPISPAPSIVPSPISSPMILLTVPSPIATPATAETKGFLTESGAVRRMHIEQLYGMPSGIHTEERRVRLELAEIVDTMRRGNEPRGDV